MGWSVTPFWGMYSTRTSAPKGFAIYAKHFSERHDYHLEIAFYRWKPGDPEWMPGKKVTFGVSDEEIFDLNPRFRIFLPWRKDLDETEDNKKKKLFERINKDVYLILMEYLKDLIDTKYLRRTEIVC